MRARNTNMAEYHGVALTDKANDSRELWVYSEEILPFIQKELKGVEQDNEIKTVSPTGEQYNSQLKTSNGIKCTYKDDASNRTFPPDVRKGEQVTIFNLGDTDTWYWRSDGRNDGARRLEKYRVHVGGTLENNPELTDDNTYFFEMDTRERKRICISTSAADGEAFRYMLEIDCDNCEVSLTDDKGNQFNIESKIPRVCMKNSDNSLIDLNMKDVTVACEGNLSLSIGGSITIKAGGGVTSSVDGALSTSAKGGTATETTGAKTSMKDGKYTMELKKDMDIKSEGEVKVTGNTMNVTPKP